MKKSSKAIYHQRSGGSRPLGPSLGEDALVLPSGVWDVSEIPDAVVARLVPHLQRAVGNRATSELLSRHAAVQRLPITLPNAHFPRPEDLYPHLKLETQFEATDRRILGMWWQDDHPHHFRTLDEAAAAVRTARASLTALVPTAPGRSRFTPDPSFLASDISARAITDVGITLETTPGLALEERTHKAPKYRVHPKAFDLQEALASFLGGGGKIELQFPPDTGEVMYVITANYDLILGARSGHQRDLPHPTLAGGLDPEMLSAGLVEFKDGRISKVHINASGHFKPNAPSSIEVSLGLFNRLPPMAFHPKFEGFKVFGQVREMPLLGPSAQEEEGSPFAVLSGPEERGTTELTPALKKQQKHASVEKLLAKTGEARTKQATQWLKENLADAVPVSDLDPIFTKPMRNDYESLLRALEGLDRGQRFRALRNATFDRLERALHAQLAKF